MVPCFWSVRMYAFRLSRLLSSFNRVFFDRHGRRTVSLLIMCMSLLVGCGEGGTDAADAMPDASVSTAQSVSGDESVVAGISESTLLQAVYLNKRTPASFNLAQVDDSGFYTIRHIRNSDVVANARFVARVASQDALQAPQARVQADFELSSDDFTEAMQWSEVMAGKQPVYHQLVDVSESELYYQFARVAMGSPTTTEYDRVFKRSMLNRDNAESQAIKSGEQAFLGIIPPVRQSEHNIKQVIDYLWSFSESNNYGYAVVSTAFQAYSDHYRYMLTEAQLDTATGTGCDRIQIMEKRYDISRSTGRIRYSIVPVGVLWAQPDSQGGSLCVPASLQ